MSRKLHIFTREGHTFTFLYEEILVDNETTLVFSYHTQNDEIEKVAHFIKANIAGYSVGHFTKKEIGWDANE